jgi:hypothetical protein
MMAEAKSEPPTMANDVCVGSVLELDFTEWEEDRWTISVPEECITRNNLKDGDYVEVTLRKYGFQP